MEVVYESKLAEQRPSTQGNKKISTAPRAPSVASPPSAPPATATSFEVGQTVFVRSRAIDRIINKKNWNPRGLAFSLAQVCSILPKNEIRVVLATRKKEEILVQSKDVLHAGESHPVRNMIDLVHLNEATVLDNLFTRFSDRQQKIYTYAGPILLAVNPYQVLVDKNGMSIYSESYVERYRSDVVGSARQEPHIYELANSVFLALLDEQKDQSVVISGESGSGKTEATKQLMHFLTQTARGASKDLSHKLLQSNPILEAFGNAKTVRNDNSSRFGKYVKINLLAKLSANTKEAQLNGAKINDYLLEKSRVVHQAPGERNYHIFYYLLCGLSSEEKQELHILSNYRYLQQPVEKLSSDEKAVAQNAFATVKDGLKLVGIHGEAFMSVIKCLSAILLLGNVDYASAGLREACAIAEESSPLITTIASFLGLKEDELRANLVVRETQAENTTVTSPLTVDEARSGVDALAKSLYERLFSFVLKKVNESLAYEEQNDAGLSLGILDIFGFEVFDENGFEQLCINFANEKLQQLYTTYVFQLEERLYEREDIDYSSVSFTDNSAILELLERMPMGVFPLLDEACLFPQASDESFLSKCTKAHGTRGGLYKAQLSQGNKGPSFTICHSASDVNYCVKGFLEKNKDRLRSNLCKLLQRSDNEIISSLFPFSTKAADTTSKLTGAAAFLGSKFRASMGRLRRELESTTPHFIRCLKSNSFKKPNCMEQPLVLHQLRYLGVLDSIRVNQEGFSSRQPYAQFYERFFLIDTNAPTLDNFTTEQALKDACRGLACFMWEKIPTLSQDSLKVFHEHIQFGVTMVFMRADTLQTLEAFRKRCLVAQENAATNLQAVWRMRSVNTSLRRLRRAIPHFVSRWKHRKERELISKRRAAIALIQHEARAWVARQRYCRQKKAILLLQSIARKLHQQRQFIVLRDAMRKLRLMLEGFLIKMRKKKLIAAAKRIQRAARLRTKLLKAARIIQSTFRGHFFRRRHATLLALLSHAKEQRLRSYTARKLQATWRGFLVRRRLKELVDAALDIQQWAQFLLQRRLFQMQRKGIRILQRVLRGYMGRRKAQILRTKRLLEIEKRRLNGVRHAEMISSLKSRPMPPAVNTIPLPGAMRSSQRAFACRSVVDGFRAFRSTQVVDVDVLADVSATFPGGMISQLMRLEDKHGRIKHIYVGTSHVVVLVGNGEAFSFGWNDRGQCGCESSDPLLHPRAIRFGPEKDLGFKLPIRSIAVGNDHTLALTIHGKVFAWGGGGHGQLGNGKFTDEGRPTSVDAFKSRKVKSIACGAYHSVALMCAGSVYTWGGGGRVLGLGVFSRGDGDRSRPCAVKALSHEYIADIASGRDFTLALTGGGTVYSWGENEHGQLGLNDTKCRFRPAVIRHRGSAGDVRTILIKCGAHHAILVDDEGKVFVWGANASGQLGLGDTSDRNQPMFNSNLPQAHFQADHVACGWRQTVFLHENELYICGMSHATAHEILRGTASEEEMRRNLADIDALHEHPYLLPQRFQLRRGTTAEAIGLSFSSSINFLTVAYKQKASAHLSSFNRPFFHSKHRHHWHVQPRNVSKKGRSTMPSDEKTNAAEAFKSHQEVEQASILKSSTKLPKSQRKRRASPSLSVFFERKHLLPQTQRLRAQSQPHPADRSKLESPVASSDHRPWYMRDTKSRARARRSRRKDSHARPQNVRGKAGRALALGTRDVDAELEKLLANIQDRAWADVESLLRSRGDGRPQ